MPPPSCFGRWVSIRRPEGPGTTSILIWLISLRAWSSLPARTCFSATTWTSLRSQASKVTPPLTLPRSTSEPGLSGTVCSKRSFTVTACAAAATSNRPQRSGRLFWIGMKIPPLGFIGKDLTCPYVPAARNVAGPRRRSRYRKACCSLLLDLEALGLVGRATTDDLKLLLAVMPPAVRATVEAHPRRTELVELVLDLGRLPEARFPDGGELLSQEAVTREEIAYVVERIGRFGKDNRAGIERTLHRISAIRNRVGDAIGLTCRVGRAVFGTVDILRDVIESGESILLLGRPGVRNPPIEAEPARVLADELDKRVVVVDTSNEIDGDGDIPHPGIGRARRMQVRTPAQQHAVMIEAVENHMPQVIVIDEIGTELEASAARTIAERGVQLIGTAHGNNLDNLMLNPTLSDLIGGIQSVPLGDEEARRRRSQKSVLERKAPPTFDVIVEIQDRERVTVHADVAETVDSLLRGDPVAPELRWRDEE